MLHCDAKHKVALLIVLFLLPRKFNTTQHRVAVGALSARYPRLHGIARNLLYSVSTFHWRHSYMRVSSPRGESRWGRCVFARSLARSFARGEVNPCPVQEKRAMMAKLHRILRHAIRESVYCFFISIEMLLRCYTFNSRSLTFYEFFTIRPSFFLSAI